MSYPSTATLVLEREPQATEGSDVPEVTTVWGRSCFTTQDALEDSYARSRAHHRATNAHSSRHSGSRRDGDCLPRSFLLLVVGKLDPGSSDKCVFAALLNDVCGVW